MHAQLEVEVRQMGWVRQKVLGVKPLYVYKGLKQYWYIAQLHLQSNRGKQYTLNIAVPITWQGEWLEKFLKSIEGRIEFKDEHPKGRIFECESISKTNVNQETTIIDVPIIAEAEAQICRGLGDKVTVKPLDFVLVNFDARRVAFEWR